MMRPRAVTPRRALATLAAVFAALFVLYTLVARAAVSWDLTAEGSATLSDTTRNVLAHLDRRVEITAFFPHDVPGRVEAATLLARYRKANRKITFRVVDPRVVPGEVQRLGVQGTGSAAVQDVAGEKKIEIAQYTIEIDLTSAIARLLRGDQGTVCFTTGHGELTYTSGEADSLSEAAELLRSNGYETREVDLLTKDHVPSSCAAVVVAAPINKLEKRSRRILSRYLEGAGKALLLGDPSSPVDLTPIGKPWGIRFEQGIVLEGDDNAHLPNDVTAPIVTRYAGASPVVRGLGPTFLPRAMGIEVRDTKDPGLSVGAIALTSPLGYLDREDVGDFDPKIDRKGPITLGASADRSEVVRPGTPQAGIKRTRVLAWGDVHFATDTFLQDGSNARLWLQGIDWLTQPEDLVTAVPNFPKLRELELTGARSRYMLFLMAGVVPGLFVIAGAFVWVVRRSR
jgi:gliding motility-associatede transport system auxiliary component